MSNPRVYFKIANDCLIPTIMQSRSLYKKMNEPDIALANIRNYNEYTREFVAANANSNDVFWSENYDFNHDTCTFNFYQLTKNTESDWVLMTTEEFLFDMEKDYSATTNPSDPNSGSLIDTIKLNTPCPDTSDGFYFEDKKWNLLVRNIMKHQNTMLIGPTGAGKTDVVIRICEKLNVPCRIYDMGAMMDPLTDLLGSHRLENGSSKFDFAKFVQDVQEPGVILLDELSRAPIMTNNILFPCLDMRRELPIDIADSNSDRRIKINPDVTFIATANIGQEYNGTCDIDAALANRFMTIQVDYLPEKIETEILTIRTGIDNANAKRIVNVANSIRERYYTGDITKPISTRETIMCAEMFVDGFTLMDAIDLGICEKYLKHNASGDDEYSTVKKIVMGF